MLALFFISAAFNKTQAQTTADSALVVTDTSVTTTSNVVVTDSSGSTTLFAGGQQSGYNGKVGIGTSSPTSKLTIYDDTKASLRISQPYTPTTTGNNIRSSHAAANVINGGTANQGTIQQAVMGGNNQPISNFDINILDAPTEDGFFQPGSVMISTSSSNSNITSTHTSSAGMNSAQLVDWRCMGLLGIPALSYSSSSYGWYTPICVNGAVTGFNLSMYLDPSVFAVDLNSVFNKNLTVGDDFKVNTSDHITYAREIKVQATAFPDFVFDKNYHQMGLHDLEKYINTNHHLPQIPTAKEAETDGVNVGDMQNKLLQKIEELTLIVIEQNKRIDELEKKK